MQMNLEHALKLLRSFVTFKGKIPTEKRPLEAIKISYGSSGGRRRKKNRHVYRYMINFQTYLKELKVLNRLITLVFAGNPNN